MRKLKIIGLFYFISILQSMAQFDFRNGCIINNNNDTIYGLIDNKGNKANARECLYRTDINSGNQIFSPEEIKGYRFINGKYYVSKPVNFHDEIQQMFLEYLINGIIDIYYYRDNKGEHYLIDIGADVLYELKNEEKELFINNLRYIEESKEYIGLLKYAFKDSPTISGRVNNIKLDHKSLIKIAHDYHQEVCSDEECIIYEKKLPVIENKYGFITGINGMSISHTNKFIDEFYYMRNSKFKFEIFPSIGLYYKGNMPFLNERLYFQYECTYSHVKLTTFNSYIDPIYNMNYLNDITLTQNVFNNFGFLKYEFPQGKIRPTFQIGAFVKYFFKIDFKRDLEVKYSWGDTYFTQRIEDNPFKRVDIGINLGFGFKKLIVNNKEIFIDIRYQRGFGLLKELNTNTYLVNLGFQIGK